MQHGRYSSGVAIVTGGHMTMLSCWEAVRAVGMGRWRQCMTGDNLLDWREKRACRIDPGLFS